MTAINKLTKITKKLSDKLGAPIKKSINNLEKKYKIVKAIKNNKDEVEKVNIVIKRKYDELNTIKKVKVTKKIKTFKEIKELGGVVDILDEYRIKRKLYENQGIMIQNSIIDIKLDTKFIDLKNDRGAMFIHSNFKTKILKIAHDALFNKGRIIIDAGIQALYGCPRQVDENPDNAVVNTRYTMVESFGRNIDPNEVVFRIELESSDVQVIFLGYRIAFETFENKKLPKNKYRELKAFKPSSDRKFHEMTCGSTTDEKLCIYETFLDVSGIRQLKYRKDNIANRKELKKMLKDEGVAIEKNVIEGRLLDSLELLTKKYDNEVLVVFYNKNANEECDFPFAVKSGTLIEFESHNTDAYLYRKAFLYHKNIHVAPFFVKKIDKIEEKENLKTKYKLRPEFLKINKKNIDGEKEKRCIKNILGFDTETYLDDTLMCKVFNLVIYGRVNDLNISKSFYGEHKQVMNDFINFINHICTKKDNKKSRPNEAINDIFMYGFNNSRFDNLFIYEKLYEEDPETGFIFTKNAIKKIEFNNVHIFDLNLYYAGSLDYVAKQFKLEETKGIYPYRFPNKDNLDYIGEVPDVKYFKSKEDYEKVKEQYKDKLFNLKEYTEKYCLMDAKLVYLMAIKHLDESLQFINGRLADTQYCASGAGIALKCYVQIFLNDTLEQSPDKIILNEKQAYKGGRTEVFKRMFNRQTHRKLYYFDINSSYPSSMVKEMPFKYISTIPKEEKTYGVKDIIEYNNYLSRVEYIGKDKKFIQNILTRVDEGDIIATNDTEYSYNWGCELIEAIKNGCKVYIKSCDRYEPKAIFKEYSEHYYKERLGIKETNVAKANFFKLLLNSLYGKFGQKNFTKKVMCKNSNEMYEILGKDNKLINFEVLENNMLFEYETKGSEYNSIGKLVRFSSYITALSRCKLSEIIRDIGVEHIYYCDTDSIFTDKKPSDKFINATELGMWKEEEPDGIDFAVFLAPKAYYYVIDATGKQCKKAKGIIGKDLDCNDYIDLAENHKNKICQERDMFFRSFNGVRIENQDRHIQTVYNKRIWDGNDSYSYKNVEQWRREKEYKKNYNKVLKELLSCNDEEHNKILKLNKKLDNNSIKLKKAEYDIMYKMNKLLY